jgi:hypothetical protein
MSASRPAATASRPRRSRAVTASPTECSRLVQHRRYARPRRLAGGGETDDERAAVRVVEFSPQEPSLLEPVQDLGQRGALAPEITLQRSDRSRTRLLSCCGSSDTPGPHRPRRHRRQSPPGERRSRGQHQAGAGRASSRSAPQGEPPTPPVTALGVAFLYGCTVVALIGWFLMLTPFRAFIAVMPRVCWGSL